MGSIPHGNVIFAGGAAVPFTGPPTLGAPTTTGTPAFSIFPSFNTGPIAIPAPPAATTIRAAGSSELLSVPGGGFTQYTLANPASATNPRTPFLNTPPVFPAAITQQLVNDPIILLQQKIDQQVAEGCTFEGVAINIATQASITFSTTPPTAPPAGGPTVTVNVADSSGGIENLPFLVTNADSALIFATFWIERVTRKNGERFMPNSVRTVRVPELPCRADSILPHLRPSPTKAN